jgi:hypothetical protein
MFVWGGLDASGAALDTGAIYDPALDFWATVAVDANTPTARVLSTAVWTGTEVVVWGGGDPDLSNVDYADGAMYMPETDSWRPMLAVNPAGGRRGTVGAWTGSRALFWGGVKGNGQPGGRLDVYDPINDAWSSAPATDAPSRRTEAATAWSGALFYVYGGIPANAAQSATAHAYDPATNEWSPLPDGPSARYGCFGQWDGARFLVWGGRADAVEQADGFRYDPSSVAWSALPPAEVPSARWAPDRVTGWTAKVDSSRILLLGGLSEDAVSTDGAVYQSGTNTWTPVEAWPSAEEHLGGAGVWTGSEFVVWSGLNGGSPTGTGERLLP